jgi:hypothetical protein
MRLCEGGSHGCGREVCGQFDQRVVARITLAAILWLTGLPDQAMRVAARNVDDAKALDHAISLTYALAQSACPMVVEARLGLGKQPRVIFVKIIAL